MLVLCSLRASAVPSTRLSVIKIMQRNMSRRPCINALLHISIYICNPQNIGKNARHHVRRKVNFVLRENRLDKNRKTFLVSYKKDYC